MSSFVRKMDENGRYFHGDSPSYVEACMVPFSWHTHLAKAFRGVEISDFLPDQADYERWNIWFDAFSSNETIKVYFDYSVSSLPWSIKPVLADKTRLDF